MKKIELEEFKEKLKRYNKGDIIVSSHAEIRALARGIDLDEVKFNILNPRRLFSVLMNQDKSRYECYFEYSKTHCHKYVLVLNSKVIIVTVISINRDWQRKLR
jgi:hypothetical protein